MKEMRNVYCIHVIIKYNGRGKYLVTFVFNLSCTKSYAMHGYLMWIFRVYLLMHDGNQKLNTLLQKSFPIVWFRMIQRWFCACSVSHINLLMLRLADDKKGHAWCNFEEDIRKKFLCSLYEGILYAIEVLTIILVMLK